MAHGSYGREMNENATHQLLVLRGLDEIEKVHEAICAEMESQRYSSHDIFCVRLALDESLNNALRHGNGLDPSKQVKVSYNIQRDKVWIRIEDEGSGFCPDDVPDPTQQEYLDQPGGRGLHVMRSFMCSVQYNGQGNCVTMCKKRSQETADTAW